MSGEAVRLTVNDVEVRVPPWARWRDAVTTYLPEAGASLSTGTGFLADESGEPVDPDGHVVPGAHIRFHDAGEGNDE
jgi:hypothetical protein